MNTGEYQAFASNQLRGSPVRSWSKACPCWPDRSASWPAMGGNAQEHFRILHRPETRLALLAIARRRYISGRSSVALALVPIIRIATLG